MSRVDLCGFVRVTSASATGAANTDSATCSPSQTILEQCFAFIVSSPEDQRESPQSTGEPRRGPTKPWACLPRLTTREMCAERRVSPGRCASAPSKTRLLRLATPSIDDARPRHLGSRPVSPHRQRVDPRVAGAAAACTLGREDEGDRHAAGHMRTSRSAETEGAAR